MAINLIWHCSTLFQKIRQVQAKREQELAESTRNGNTQTQLLNGQNTNGNNQGIIGSALANIFVVIGLAAFAYTVKYVLRNVVE
jgi:ubiquitin-conjugating enzyme E2 J2